MIRLESRDALRAFQQTVDHSKGLRVGFVPTMGALHEGHQSLIIASKTQCDITIVSIFVNPTQFGPNEDLNRYPRQITKDIEICEQLEVDVVFIPSELDIYPNGDKEAVYKPNKHLSSIMCGKSRPLFFDGVCNVLERLFRMIQPTHAFFGDKDLQQRVIVENMVNELGLEIEIIACKIIRDENGLAFSSRNQYLSQKSYSKALELPKLLKQIQIIFSEGQNQVAELVNLAVETLSKRGLDVDYVAFYNVKSRHLSKECITQDDHCCIAVKCDGVRLIDNCSMKIEF